MDYWQLVTKAWRLVWHHRFVWVLAVVAGAQSACGGLIGLGVWAGFAVPLLAFPPGSSRGSGPGRDVAPRTLDTLSQVEASVWLLVAGLLLVLLMLLIVYWVINTIAGAGIIRAVSDLDSGRAAVLGAAWRQGVGAFWRFLRLGLLVFVTHLLGMGLPILVVAAPALGAYRASDERGLFLWFGVAMLLFMAVGYPLSIVTTVIVTLAQRAIAIDGQKVFPSLANVIRLLRSRLGASLVLWLIYWTLTLGVGTVISFAAPLLALPVVLMAALGSVFFGIVGALVLGFLPSMMAVALLWFAGSLADAFLSAYWTLAYLRLTQGASASRG